MFYFKYVETEEELEKVYKLRYNVYCIEKSWLFAPHFANGQEFDDFDQYSAHVIALNNDKQIIATQRIIRINDQNQTLPFIHHPGFISPPILNSGTAEISRVIVDKKFRKPAILLGLFRHIYHYFKTQENLSSYYMVVNFAMFKLLKSLLLPILSIGKSYDYYGDITLPIQLYLDNFDEELELFNPKFLDWLKKDYSYLDETFIFKFFKRI